MTVLKSLKGIAEHKQQCGESIEVAPSTLLDIIESLEAAEKRVAELEVLSVTRIIMDIVPGHDGMGEEIHAKSISEVESLISRLYERLEDVKTELSRRDAASGEASDCIIDDGCNQRIGGVPVSDRLNCTWPVGTIFYTAPQQAVLPPEMSYREALQVMYEKMIMGDARSFYIGANWMREQVKSLGCQPPAVAHNGSDNLDAIISNANLAAKIFGTSFIQVSESGNLSLIDARTVDVTIKLNKQGEKEKFLDFLKYASAQVDKWPDWKKSGLGFNQSREDNS